MAKCYGIGVGPGDPDLLTLKALKLLRVCPVVAAPDNATAFDIARGVYEDIESKEYMPLKLVMTKDVEKREKAYRQAVKEIENKLDEGKDVACLTLGDVSVYSTFMYMYKLLTEDGYEAEIVPGITSFCASAARMGISLGEREESIHIIASSYDLEKELDYSGTKIYMKAGKQISKLRELLQKKDKKAYAISNCGMPEEKVYESLDELGDDASYYSLIIVKD